MLQGFRTYRLSVELYGRCKKVPATYYERDQLLRAALSVVLNLAEGSAKSTPKERRRFYGISLASLREVQALLDILGSREAFELADRIGAGLYNLARSPAA